MKKRLPAGYREAIEFRPLRVGSTQFGDDIPLIVKKALVVPLVRIEAEVAVAPAAQRYEKVAVRILVRHARQAGEIHPRRKLHPAFSQDQNPSALPSREHEGSGSKGTPKRSTPRRNAARTSSNDEQYPFLSIEKRLEERFVASGEIRQRVRAAIVQAVGGVDMQILGIEVDP